jgi:hypothetical protein
MGHFTDETAPMSTERTTAQRQHDTLELLATHGRGWLASASPEGAAHLIAVSACWTGENLLIATRGDSPTGKNLAATRTARLALGDPENAVLVDVTVADQRRSGPGSGELGEAFLAAMGWDPAEEPGAWDYFVLRPVRVQAYRGYGEVPGSTIMRDGRWLG